jgi:serine/threonine protein phosphatase 1
MLFQKIPKPSKGRRFVISDIHGCAKTFQKLVNEKLQLTKEDQLFLLGDYINRGPDNTGVIDFIIDLQNTDYQVFALRGNHEIMLINSHLRERKADDYSLPRLQKRRGIVGDDLKILPKYEGFFLQLPYYFELDKYYLVHAGFNFDKVDFLEDFEPMLWIKDFKVDIIRLNGKRIVHGHSVKPISEIQKNITSGQPVIPLDNGCYYGINGNEEEGYGHLCAFNLDSMELITQVCID